VSAKRPIVDGHCDTLMRLIPGGRSPGGPTRLADLQGGHMDLGRLWESPVGLQFFALFTPPGSGSQAIPMILAMIRALNDELRDHPDKLHPVRTPEDVDGDGVGCLLAIEGLRPIGDDVRMLETFHELGVRSAMLTWNERNALADGAMDQGSGGGLSNAGRDAVHLMEELGWAIDVSHLGDAPFFDLVKKVHEPILATHSNARAVYNHPRNLTDDQIRAVADLGGAVGVNFHSGFITDGEATLDDLFRHLDHLMKIGGEDLPGFGSDYDGIEQPPTDAPDVRAYSLIWERLITTYGSETAAKLAGGNFRRVLRSRLPQGA